MRKKKIPKQNLNQETGYHAFYSIRLLFKEKAVLPIAETVHEKLKGKFGNVSNISGSEILLFALNKHIVKYKEGKLPAQVMISECMPIKEPIGDAATRAQFWDCSDGVALLDSCTWQVVIGDMMAAELPPLVRAEILADFLDAVMHLFANCQAVFFERSGKLLTAEQVRSNPYSGALRFIYGGVNARLFNVEGSDDKIVDTLGLHALGLPDVQYYFHGIDVNDVVNHAYNLAIYQFENNAPINSGNTVDGIEPDAKWKCQYEYSLVEPKREVLDVNTGSNAAGKR